jgi:hypothetical protein
MNCSHFTDFKSSEKCNARHLMTTKFFADSDHCGKKHLSEFKVGEERFASLDDCCNAKFPQSISVCCGKEGLGGCVLSGNVKYIPVSMSAANILFSATLISHV